MPNILQIEIAFADSVKEKGNRQNHSNNCV